MKLGGIRKGHFRKAHPCAGLVEPGKGFLGTAKLVQSLSVYQIDFRKTDIGRIGGLVEELVIVIPKELPDNKARGTFRIG